MGFIDNLKRKFDPCFEEDEMFEEMEGRNRSDDLFDDYFEQDKSRRYNEREVRNSEGKRRMQNNKSMQDEKIYNLNTRVKYTVVLKAIDKFESVSEVADSLRNGYAVVLNLETCDDDIARRIIDFCAGVTYATDGNIKKISSKTFLITPCSIDIVGDVLDELSKMENGFFVYNG